ncbi:MAG: hypothetical protein IPJ01_10030 [Micavibrio sp.]|nr:hypothetical protein [Micavibrio sp.]
MSESDFEKTRMGKVLILLRFPTIFSEFCICRFTTFPLIPTYQEKKQSFGTPMFIIVTEIFDKKINQDFEINKTRKNR